MLAPAINNGLNSQKEIVILQFTEDQVTNSALDNILVDHPNAIVIKEDNSINTSWFSHQLWGR